VDTGVTQGDGISTYYDNMIAKLIVWDQDRTRALQRMRLALSQYQIVGLVTNTAFLKQVVDHPAFIKGEVTTSFIPVSL
jgi:3-methylcrotonyl-CoA carboxylase alpha subunit